MSKSLPSRPNLEQLKKQAKDFLKAHESGDAETLQRIQANHPDYSNASKDGIRAAKFSLGDAQLVIAREYGFASWPKLKEHVESLLLETADPKLGHARGGDGQTPLHFASTVQIAEYLLEHGAEIDARDVDHESTPAQWMIRERQEVARYLVRRGCKTDILMAAALGELELIGKHLDDDPECIHMRVSNEYFRMINLKAGGTTYQWTLRWYVSPHHVARQFGHEDAFRLLIERSPQNVRLIAACWSADEAAVKKLLAENSRLVAKLSEAYRRQIAHAARNNNLAAVRIMLAAGLPVDEVGQH